MKHVVADLETNDLLDDLTTIHCISLREFSTNKLVSCTDNDPNRPSIEHGLDILARADRMYFHNGIAFDIPAIKKLHPRWEYSGRLVDTLVVARTRFAHIKDGDWSRFRKGKLPGNLIGSHSLKAWGYRLGVWKGSYGEQKDAWEKWSEDMQVYCDQDTTVTRVLMMFLRKVGLPQQALHTEHALAGYLAHQERNGWPFDHKAAVELQAKLAAKRHRINQRLTEHFGSWIAKGKEFTPKRDNRKMGYVKGCVMTKLKVIDFNPNSRPHVANRLKRIYGWEPDAVTDTGLPKIDEDTLKTVPDSVPVKQELLEQFLLSRRLGQLVEGPKSWINYMRPNEWGGHSIHHYCNPAGTVTHRASHSNPNMNVPKVGKPYGEECRSLFTPPPGWAMVGADMSGLELRCLAHYMARYDDGAYVKVILEGDVHTVNQEAAGLGTRDLAKTFIYAFLYGAGDVLIGAIVLPGGTEDEQRDAGSKLKAKFLKGLPALGELVKQIKRRAKKYGWLKLIDGRRGYIRHQHAALNSLLQGTGAVICKAWIVEYDKHITTALGPQGWDGNWGAMGWLHDENQLAVRKGNGRPKFVAAQMVAAAQHMTEHFNFRCPLDGEAKIGRNWAETH